VRYRMLPGGAVLAEGLIVSTPATAPVPV
jgi:hypothetical protein